MKKTLMAVAGSLVLLSGCATNQDYVLYSQTQQAIANSRASSEIARYQALVDIAKNGDTTAKAVAAVTLQLSGSGQSTNQQIAPPVSTSDRILQWTGILLPSLTNLYGINANRQVAITQSNNQAAVAQSTNNTFATMNSNMATSNTAIANTGLSTASTIANSGLTAVTNVANTGIAQVGSTAAAGLTAVTNVNASSNTAITNVSNASADGIKAVIDVIPQLQPNVTTTSTTNNTTSP
jgi:hypothetical protein